MRTTMWIDPCRRSRCARKYWGIDTAGGVGGTGLVEEFDELAQCMRQEMRDTAKTARSARHQGPAPPAPQRPRRLLVWVIVKSCPCVDMSVGCSCR